MPNFTQHPTIMALEISLRPDMLKQFVDWQSELNAIISGFDGFVSLEFLSLADQENGWAVVQRFNNSQNASQWHNSAGYKKLLDELNGFVIENGIKEDKKCEANLNSGVVEVFIIQIKPKYEAAFREWSAKIHQAEAKFPGFRGVYIQSPENREQNWITLLQFDSHENLDRWLESPERVEILKEASTFISSFETHRMVSPYGGWFSSIAKTGQLPPAWKQSMVVLLVLYPIVMLEILFLMPWIKWMGLAPSTFVGNLISVTLLTFPMMPLAIFCLSWWLSPGINNRKEKSRLGAALVILIYFLEVLLFWFFV